MLYSINELIDNGTFVPTGDGDYVVAKGVTVKYVDEAEEDWDEEDWDEEEDGDMSITFIEDRGMEEEIGTDMGLFDPNVQIFSVEHMGS